MKKHVGRKVGSLLLTLTILTTMVVPAYASQENSSTMDMSLDNESAWFESISSQNFTTLDSQEDVYIPNGAEILGIEFEAYSINTDYTLDNVRYLVSYYDSGLIDKAARSVGGGDTILYVDNETNEIKEYSAKEEILFDASEDQSTQKSSQNYVFPNMYYDFDGTRPYDAEIEEESTVYLPALGNLGYASWQKYRIYVTIGYHELEEATGHPYTAGTALKVLAAFWEVAENVAKGWLQNFNILISLNGILEESCAPVKSAEYSCRGGKEIGIYDPTYHNAFVDVLEYWSPGLVNMFSQYGSGEFRNYTWGYSAEPDAINENSSQMLVEARDIYNGNVEISGWWKFGKGNFGS